MAKITIELREGQLERLHEHKQKTGCPVVEAVRRAIDAYFMLPETVGTNRADSRRSEAN